MALKIDGVSAFFAKLTTAFNNSTVLKGDTSLSVSEIIRKEGTKVSGVLSFYSGVANIALNTTLLTVYARSTGASNLFVKNFIISSNKDCRLQLNIVNAAGINANVGVVNHPFRVKAGESYIYPYNDFVPWGASLQMIFKTTTDTTGTLEVELGHDSYEFFQHNDFYAPMTVLGIGDSIMKGGNSTTVLLDPYKSYFSLVYKYLKGKGYRIKGVNKGIPSGTADDITAAMRWGYFDIDKVNLILYCAGTNTSASTGAFTSALDEMMDYLQKRYPTAVKLIMAPTTRLDASESTVASYRTIISNKVTSLADPKFKYLNLALSFNASDPQFGLIVDSQNHPNDVGHAAIATYINNYLTANNIQI